MPFFPPSLPPAHSQVQKADKQAADWQRQQRIRQEEERRRQLAAEMRRRAGRRISDDDGHGRRGPRSAPPYRRPELWPGLRSRSDVRPLAAPHDELAASKSRMVRSCSGGGGIRTHETP